MKAALLVVLCGCIGDIDPPWQLDHDRVVVVRATPPRVQTGQTSLFDGLIAHKGGPSDVEQPIGATAVKPLSLYPAVLDNQGVWGVVGPDAATLDAARDELALPAGAPVPFEVAMEFPSSNGHSLFATKIVWLGDTGDNPAAPAITFDGEPPGDAIQIPADTDVPLATDVAPAWKVNWLTSCGTMHDDDEHAAFVHVLPADRQAGELAVVLRDDRGGVSWRVWPMSVSQ